MTLTERALKFAVSQVGVRELGRNRGPRVDEYIRAAGLDPERGSYPWCACFVRWCFLRAFDEMADEGIRGTFTVPPKTGSVHKLWKTAPLRCRTSQPMPGHVFLIDHGAGTGHCGFVSDVTGTHILTVEGNTGPGGTREGDGVYARNRRLTEINLGYLNFDVEHDAAPAPRPNA